MEIRQMSAVDVNAVYEYGREFWEQTRYHKEGVEYDELTVKSTLQIILDSGVGLIAEKDGRIVGLLLVFVLPFPMNVYVTQACEWVFYVDPDHRRTGLGERLLDAAEILLAGKGVRFFTMVSLTDVTPKAANKLYEQKGFVHSETSFTKTLFK